MKEKIIEINAPYLSYNEDGTICRYNVDVIKNGELEKLFAEVEKEYAVYLCTERLDAIVYLVLPIAIREGYDIYCKAPVTEMFLHNLNEILIPHLVIGDPNLHKITVFAQTDSRRLGGSAIGTAVSCGVDSLYTIKEYTNGKYPEMQLTHLFITPSNVELCFPVESNLKLWEQTHKQSFIRFNKVSDALDLPLVKMYTNFFWYLTGHGKEKYDHLWTHQYITMANVLVLKKLWKIYLFSSTYDFSLFTLKDNATEDTAHHELLSMHVLAVPDFQCFSAGAEADRVKKTLALTDYEIARKTLHPCRSSGEKNCSDPDCGKCLRGLLTLDYYDKLDTMSEVFDIERYKRERPKYFRKCIEFRSSAREQQFFEKLYNMMCEKYPYEMRTEEEKYMRSIEPISRSVYTDLVDVYAFSVNLLSSDSPERWLKKYFANKGIKKLYCSGRSRIGDKIVQLISDEISCVTIQNSNPDECDASLVLNTRTDETRRLCGQLKSKGAKQILTIKNIKSAFDSEHKGDTA